MQGHYISNHTSLCCFECLTLHKSCTNKLQLRNHFASRSVARCLEAKEPDTGAEGDAAADVAADEEEENEEVPDERKEEPEAAVEAPVTKKEKTRVQQR